MSDVRQSDAAVEPFVRVVVTDTDLEFNCLHKFPFLAFFEHVVDVLLEEVGVNLGH